MFGTLGGMLDGKSYITVSEMRNENGQPSGYLFLCSSGEQLTPVSYTHLDVYKRQLLC